MNDCRLYNNVLVFNILILIIVVRYCSFFGKIQDKLVRDKEIYLHCTGDTSGNKHTHIYM